MSELVAQRVFVETSPVGSSQGMRADMGVRIEVPAALDFLQAHQSSNGNPAYCSAMDLAAGSDDAM